MAGAQMRMWQYTDRLLYRSRSVHICIYADTHERMLQPLRLTARASCQMQAASAKSEQHSREGLMAAASLCQGPASTQCDDRQVRVREATIDPVLPLSELSHEWLYVLSRSHVVWWLGSSEIAACS